jgi:hypothetical protein
LTHPHIRNLLDCGISFGYVETPTIKSTVEFVVELVSKPRHWDGKKDGSRASLMAISSRDSVWSKSVSFLT